MALVDDFFNAHPKLDYIELVVVDPGGVLRGKWAPASALKKAFSDGVNFPLSLHGLDIWGNEVDGTGLHISSGDLDGFFVAVPNTLAAVPWGSDVTNEADASTAQVVLQTLTPDHTPFDGCARTVLQNVMARFDALSMTPVCAFELEFHLLRPESEWRNGQYEVAVFDDAGDAQFMYGLDALAEKAPVFADIRRAAKWAGLPVDTIVKEAGEGQFEVNLAHRADALRAADDVILLKRIVQESARKHGLVATFMAKPFLDQPGNGLHVHTSILNGAKENVFAGKQGSVKQHQMVAGLLSTMQEMTLVFVNTYNGFRRMAPGSYAPTRTNWGENNRSVAIRLPAASDNAKRIEHRVSGADANPYLVLAAILHGMLAGLEAGKAPPPELVGNAYDETTPNRGEVLPGDMGTAIESFAKSEFCKQALGDLMHSNLVAIKRAELAAFAANMSAFEKRTFV